jgi:ferredoxin
MSSKYQKISIYCYSGTGNALLASRWILDYAHEKGVETKLHIINKDYKALADSNTANQLTGFCFPTHGFSLPWLMLKFIFHFPRINNSKVFILNTRGGLKMSKLFLPGLSGLAVLLPIIILRFKGFKIAGVRPLDMPSNWISLHPCLPGKVVNSITNRCKRLVEIFAGKVLEGQKHYAQAFWLGLPFDLAITPVAVMYFVIGRFFLSKTFMASVSCNGCGVCSKNCPTGSICLKNNRPYWKFTCESCMRCISFCPREAIQTSHLWIAVIILITGAVPVMALLSLLFGHYFLMSGSFAYSVVKFILEWLLVIPLLYVIYLLFFYLLSIKIINKIFTFGSLTYYWKRYKASGVTITSFKTLKK